MTLRIKNIKIRHFQFKAITKAAAKKKIRDFFLTSLPLRMLRSFIYKSFLPVFIRSVLVIATIIALMVVVFGFFRPEYLVRSYQSASSYFFTFLKLNNYRFSQINIQGNHYVQEGEIIKIVRNLESQVEEGVNSDISQFFIHNLVAQIKANLRWVDQVVVTRSMPHILNITITEYNPFAIWQDGDAKYLTDKGGNLIPYEDREEFQDMVILSGMAANTNAGSLFNILASDPELSANVYSATWVSNRRWDIRFGNGLLIKLPEANIASAWQRLIKIYNIPGSIVGLKVIDLRISDKTYLEYSDSVIKELKSL